MIAYGIQPQETRGINGFAGLVELVDDFDGETYRAMYTVKLAGVVYVLHVFHKKSTRGIATPKRELAVTPRTLAARQSPLRRALRPRRNEPWLNGRRAPGRRSR